MSDGVEWLRETKDTPYIPKRRTEDYGGRNRLPHREVSTAVAFHGAILNFMVLAVLRNL